MPDYLNKNGETYTEQELIGYAEEEGLTLEEYIGTKTFEVVDSGKTNDSSTETQTMESNGMGLELADGGSESPEIKHATVDQMKEGVSFLQAEGDFVKKMNEHYKDSGVEFQEAAAGREK